MIRKGGSVPVEQSGEKLALVQLRLPRRADFSALVVNGILCSIALVLIVWVIANLRESHIDG